MSAGRSASQGTPQVAHRPVLKITSQEMKAWGWEASRRDSCVGFDSRRVRRQYSHTVVYRVETRHVVDERSRLCALTRQIADLVPCERARSTIKPRPDKPTIVVLLFIEGKTVGAKW